MNLGQLSLLLRGRYLVDAIGYNHVRGLPLKAAELAEAIGGLVAEAEGIQVDLTSTGTVTPQEALS
jgi:2-oxoglutarate ferredoxin oxidoreductase subunit alpha